jgi:hypothetical protein
MLLARLRLDRALRPRYAELGPCWYRAADLGDGLVLVLWGAGALVGFRADFQVASAPAGVSGGPGQCHDAPV